MSDLSYVRNNDGTYSKLVQLSGRKVDVLTLLVSTAKRDTAEIFTASIDLSIYRYVDFILKTSLNQTFTVKVYNDTFSSINVPFAYKPDGTTVINGTNAVNITAQGTWNMRSLPNLNLFLGDQKPVISKPIFRLEFPVAPTSGTIEIIARGML